MDFLQGLLSGAGNLASGIGGAVQGAGNAIGSAGNDIGSALSQDFQNFQNQQQQNQQQVAEQNQTLNSALGQDWNNLSQGVRQGVGNVAQSLFQPNPNIPSLSQQNQDIASTFANVNPFSSQFGQRSQTQPMQVNLPPEIGNIPLLGGLLSGVANAPGQSLQNVGNFAGDMSNMLSPQGNVSPQRVLGDIAGSYTLPSYFVGGGETAGLAKDALTSGGVQGLKNAVLRALPGGITLGGGFGTQSGLQANQNNPTLGGDLLNTLPSTLVGAAAGGITAGGSAAIGNILSKYVTNRLAQKLSTSFNPMDVFDFFSNKDLIQKALTDPSSLNPTERVQFSALNKGADPAKPNSGQVYDMLKSAFPTAFDRAGNPKASLDAQLTKLPALEQAYNTTKIAQDARSATTPASQTAPSAADVADYQQLHPNSPPGTYALPGKISVRNAPTVPNNDQLALNALENNRTATEQQLNPRYQQPTSYQAPGVQTPDEAQAAQVALNKSRGYGPGGPGVSEATPQDMNSALQQSRGYGVGGVEQGLQNLDQTEQQAIQRRAAEQLAGVPEGSTTPVSATAETPVTPKSPVTAETPPTANSAPTEGLNANAEQFAEENPKVSTQLPPTPDNRLPLTNPAIPVKAGPLDKIRSSMVELQHQGPTGTAVAQKIDQMYNKSSQVAGDAAYTLKQTAKGLSKDETVGVNRALAGQDVSLNPAQQAAVQARQGMLQKFADWAQQVGLSITRPDGTKVPWSAQENYFPRTIDKGALQANRQQSIDYLVNSGQITDTKAASTLIDSLIQGKDMQTAMSRALPNYVQRVGRQGNLEYSRVITLPDNVYGYSDGVLSSYIKQAAPRLAQAEQFGPNNEAVKPILDKISQEGGNAVAAKQIINQNLGLTEKDTSLNKLVGGIDTAEGAIHTGLAGYRHTGNIVNTMTSQGVIPTLRNMFSPLSREGQKLAAQAGVTTQQILDSIVGAETGTEAGGVIGRVAKTVTAPFIRPIMTINRTIAANTVKTNMDDNFSRLVADPTNQAARNYFSSVGLNPDELLQKGTLGQQDILNGVQAGVKQMLGRFAPIDKPALANTPIGKMAFLFHSYPFFQADFVNKNVLAPLRQGNAMPLARYVALSTAVGAALNAGYHAISGTQQPQDLPHQLLSDFSYAGGYGIPGEAIMALAGMYSNGQPETTPGDAMASFLKPAVVSDALSNIKSFNQAEGGNLSALAKQGIKDLPYGSDIANRVLPSATAQSSALGANVTSNPAQMLLANGVLDPTDEQTIKSQITALNADAKKQKPSSGLLGLGVVSQAQTNQKITADKQKAAILDAQVKVSDAMTADGGTLGAKTMNQLVSVEKNTLIDPATKAQIYSQFNLTPAQVKQDAFASSTSADKLSAYVQQFKGMDHTQVVDTLLQGRKDTISGKTAADATVLRGLVNAGVISATEEKTLNAIKFDANGNDISSLAKGTAKKVPAIKLTGTGSSSSSAAKGISLMPKTPVSAATKANLLKLITAGSVVKNGQLQLPKLPANILNTGAAPTSFKLQKLAPIKSNMPVSIYGVGYPAAQRPTYIPTQAVVGDSLKNFSNSGYGYYGGENATNSAGDTFNQG